jgi:preprotein translocase subunit SecD
MKSSLLWRGALIAGLITLAALSAYPLEEKINRGLDLRGGIHLVMSVQTEDALRSETDKDQARFIQELEDRGATGASANRLEDTRFEIVGVGIDRDDEVREIADEFLPGWDWQRSGETLTFSMKLQNVNEVKNLSVKQALETIRNRVDEFGVAEPVIQRQGLDGDRIVVQLPGVDDPERVKRLIKNTAFLDFRLVDYPLGGGGVQSREEIISNYGGRIPDNIEILSGSVRNSQGESVGEQYYAVERSSVITGRDLKTARPGLGEFNQPIVNFFLTHEGGQTFAEVTGANIDKGLAIVLDGRVRTAPRIKARIGDSGIIEGAFTRQEVEDLSTVLRSGALPAGIVYLEERTVGPSLGQDSIEQGMRAGLLGLLLVVIAMLIVYKATGINAVVALALNIVIIFGALAYFNATLTRSCDTDGR